VANGLCGQHVEFDSIEFTTHPVANGLCGQHVEFDSIEFTASLNFHDNLAVLRLTKSV
jgi:hypothetical protein